MAATNGALAAVFAACAALQSWDAAAQVEDRFSLRLHDYDEGEFAGAVADGSPRRYRVETAQAALQLSLRGGFELAVDALSESMSGSSPWFVLPDADGQPLQVLSGASIEEHREELALALATPASAPLVHRFHLQSSDENDYRALAAGYEWRRALDPQRSLSLGLNHSRDRLRPTDAALFGRIAGADKRSSGGFVGYTLVLDRNRQLQLGLGLDHADGYLADPYKRVLVGEQLRADQRPSRRNQWALFWRYRQALAEGRAALHLDYRGTRDDWGIRAHELELRWLGELSGGLEWGPSLRYYSQTAARFYAPFQREARADGNASSDYRLGRFGAFSLGLSLQQRFGALTVRLSAERYRSDTAWALGGAGAPVPGLVDFRHLSLGFDWAF